MGILLPCIISVLEVSWKCFECVLDVFRECIGRVLDVFYKLFGSVSSVSWTCFGSVVEVEFGEGFPFLYFGAIIAASVPAIVKHKNNINYNSLGASGAVSAVLMAFIVAHPSHTLLLFFVIPIPAILAGPLFLLFEWSMQKRGGTGIAHDAHIYGAGFGLIYALIKDPNGLSNMLSALTGLF